MAVEGELSRPMEVLRAGAAAELSSPASTSRYLPRVTPTRLLCHPVASTAPASQAIISLPIYNFTLTQQMALLKLIGRMVNECKISKSFQICENKMVRQSRVYLRHFALSPNRNPDLDPPKLSSQSTKSESKPWSVYLILSTNPPIKTYVGVTNNFSRRLKQHNGELQGGAKASRAGRPWACACIIHGFKDQSEACEFESKWKSASRKLPRKREKEDQSNKADDQSLPFLQHRQAALNKVKDLIDFSHIEIDWRLDPS